MVPHHRPHSYPAHYRPHNPGKGYGRVILGTMAGIVAGGVVGRGIARAVAPEPTLREPEDETDEAEKERLHQEYLRALERWWQVGLGLSGAMATVGAVAGAALTARPGERAAAAVGAGVGTASMRGIGYYLMTTLDRGDPILIPVSTGIVVGPAAAALGVRTTRGPIV